MLTLPVMPGRVRVTVRLRGAVPVMGPRLRMRAVLRARKFPSLNEIRRVAEDLQPGHRVRERRAVRQAADDARRQVRIDQPGKRLHELPEPFEILPRNRQHPECHAIGLTVQDAERHEQRP